MQNGNSGGVQAVAPLLAGFREADAAYQSATESERSNYFARRHAALMLVLDSNPRSRDEICDVMRIALDELNRDLMLDGPVPRAVANALANCLQAVEEITPGIQREQVGDDHRPAGSIPSEPLLDLESAIAKLDSLGGLLSYLANNAGSKEMQSVFFALLNSLEGIRDVASAAVEKLMDETSII